jgi:hypothetical protein
VRTKDGDTRSRRDLHLRRYTASFAGALGLLEGLRDPILVPTNAEDPLKRHFDHMLAELAMPSFGTRTLTEALMKICLVTILRRQLEQPGAERPIFAPLRDRRLAAAVAAIVDMPRGSHTVASLAEVAGMGRTAFAQRFVETYGRTPIDFLQACGFDTRRTCCAPRTSRSR